MGLLTLWILLHLAQPDLLGVESFRQCLFVHKKVLWIQSFETTLYMLTVAEYSFNMVFQIHTAKILPMILFSESTSGSFNSSLE